MPKLDGRQLRASIFDREGLSSLECDRKHFESKGRQGYSLLINGQIVAVCGASTAGLLHGLSHFQYILETEGLVDLSLAEAPAIELRALHIVLRRLSLDSLFDIVRRARLARFNTLIVMLTDGAALKTYPSTVRADALSKEELREFSKFARENGLNIVPEIKLLTHQQVFLKSSRPELMFNKVTYDPNNKDVYAVVGDYLDEVIDIFGADSVHIGHDEVRGFGVAARRRWLNAGEKPLDANLFFQDVVRLYEMLKKKGVETWMWGDMLLPKQMLAEILQRNFQERADYPEMIDRLPKDVVINDWHYFDEREEYPSIDYFHAKGFRVYGATWHDQSTARKFSGYMASRRWSSSGMIATTWTLAPRGQWEKVHQIITESGSAFWNGG
ncbi:MAG: family 20 glycosylhydrolase [Phycisphaerae bacterium]|nr:family 20 glycosylhydrolase [Phycisphaerae bacterium]